MKNIFFVLNLFLLLISACKKDAEQSINNGSSQAQSIELDSFPLAIGNSWKFHSEDRYTDSVGTILPAYSSTYDNYWTTVLDTLINGILTTKISQLDSSYTGSTHQAYSYYANRQDGFYRIAVENYGSMFLLRTSESFLNKVCLPISFERITMQSDSLYIPDTALYLMKFPSTINNEWNSFEVSNGIHTTRKWTGYSYIQTEAGSFNCIRLHWIEAFDDNSVPYPIISEATLYFSTKGLIQQTESALVTYPNGSHGQYSQIIKLIEVNF
jgi:hypothetical protein